LTINIYKFFKSNISNANRGFTLIEALIVIFISTLLLLGFLTLYDWHSKTYNFQQATVRVSESGRFAMQAMNTYISQSYRVLASMTINGAAYTSSSTTVVLQIPAIDSNNNVLAGKWDYAAFYGSGSKFFQDVQVDPSSVRLGEKKILSDSLASISFTYDNADFALAESVAVDLLTQVVVRDQTVSSHLTQNIYLKNY